MTTTTPQPALRDDLYKLAKLKRTKPNFEKIQEQLTELKQYAEQATEAGDALEKAREAVDELDSVLENVVSNDNPLLQWSTTTKEVVSDFLRDTPEGVESIGELIEEADGYADEYESCLDDRAYGADDREEVWGNLCNAIYNIAAAMA